MTEALALIALGSRGEVVAMYFVWSGEPVVILVLAHLVESGREWEMAICPYGSLPIGEPGRASSLLRAKLEWRRANLSSSAQEAIASPRLTRSELGILLVSLAPQLGAVEGGSSPVMSDILDLPCYLGVVTAVRADLLGFDRLDHSFFPFRTARADEVRHAVERLCHILKLRPPQWCEGAETPAGCIQFSEPVAGEQVAELVSRLTEADQP